MHSLDGARIFVKLRLVQLALLVACALILGRSADAKPRALDPTAWPIIAQGRVVRVVDGATVVLDSSVTIRLSDLDPAPQSIGAKPDGADLATLSTQALERLTKGKVLHLHAKGMTQDRYGRLTGQAVLEDGVWVQARLLSEGWARLMPLPGHGPSFNALVPSETEARLGRKGLWARADFSVLSAARAGEAVGLYGLFDGVLVHVGRARTGYYFDFGFKGSGALSLRVNAVIAQMLAGGRNHDPALLVGKHFIVRGLVEGDDRPMILITQREQINLIEDL